MVVLTVEWGLEIHGADERDEEGKRQTRTTLPISALPHSHLRLHSPSEGQYSEDTGTTIFGK